MCLGTDVGFLLSVVVVFSACLAPQAANGRQVLAVYYGWWGNPAVSGGWVHWKDVDPANERIANSAHFPAYGAYDSHDPALLERQTAAADGAGITGFIASWWGQGTFEDKGMAPLLAAAGKHGLSVSAYYEKIAGDDPASRKKAAVADLDYLLSRYGQDKAWLRAEGRPVVFVYGRALGALSPAEWQEAIAAAPDYVLITSWNEWHEGSEIEPSTEYGSLLLDETAVLSREFLHKPQ